jgi:hypothetical protein
MQFNLSSTGDDLCTLTNDFVNTNSVTYPLAKKARSANMTLKKIWFAIFNAYPGWEFDDRNNSDLPIATTPLVTGQQNYSLPSEAFTIRGVSIQVQNNTTTWQTLLPLTEELLTQIGVSEASLFTSNGTPIYYRPIGSVIKLYPSPNYSQTAALRVTFDRGISTFLPTDSTKQPGIDSEFHEMVAVGMALEYARINATSNFPLINQQWNEWEKRLSQLYSSRYQERFPTRINVQDVTRQCM